MTYSLHVRNGDLNLGGPGGFAIVSGQQKLIQDMRHWLLEATGTDPFHPEYGSSIDGGILSDGTYVESSLGGLISAETIARIESECRRVLNAYQRQQIDRISRETITYAGKNTFGLGEILASVNAINVQQVADTILVKISITTGSGDAISFTQPLG